MDWEDLRRQARRLEGGLEDKLQAYSRLAQRLQSDLLYDSEDPVDIKQNDALARDIDRLLAELQENNDKMGACVSRGGGAANSALLQRYREILFDYTSEYQKASTAMQRNRESRELFKRVEEGEGVGGQGGKRDQEMEHLLRERTAINSSLRSATGVLSQAAEARESLRYQRGLMDSTAGTLQSLSSQFPAINKVVEAIRSRSARNQAVIAATIAFCICFTLYWMMS